MNLTIFFKKARIVLAKVQQKDFGIFGLNAEHAVFDSISKEEHGKNSNKCLYLCIAAYYTHSKEQ